MLEKNSKKVDDHAGEAGPDAETHNMSMVKSLSDRSSYIYDSIEVEWTHYQGLDDSCHEWWHNNEHMPVVTFRDPKSGAVLRTACLMKQAVCSPEAVDGWVYIPLSFASASVDEPLRFVSDPFEVVQDMYKIHGRARRLISGYLLDADGQWREVALPQGLVRIYTCSDPASAYAMGVCVPNIMSIEEVGVPEICHTIDSAGPPPICHRLYCSSLDDDWAHSEIPPALLELLIHNDGTDT